MIKSTRAFFSHSKIYSLPRRMFSDAATLNYLSFLNDSAPASLVVAHGLMGNSFNFRPIVTHQELSSLCNSYLFDLRNHGKSEHKPTMSLEDMARDIEAATQKVGLEKFYLLGHSLGGKVAMVYSRLFPQRLKGLIVCDVGPYDYNDVTKFKAGAKTQEMLQTCAKIPMKGLSRQELWAKIESAANNSKSVAGLLMSNIDEVGKNEFKWKVNLDVINIFYNELLGIYRGTSKKYSGPVKVIAGRQSEYVPRNELSEFHSVFENFDTQRDIVYIEGANHWVHFTKPEEFVKEVSSFIKQRERL